MPYCILLVLIQRSLVPSFVTSTCVDFYEKIGTSGSVLVSFFMHLFQVMGRSRSLCLAFENHIFSRKKYMFKSETLSSEGLH